MIRGLAEYERAPHMAQATEADLLRDGFGPDPKFHCVIADWEERLLASPCTFTTTPHGKAVREFSWKTSSSGPNFAQGNRQGPASARGEDRRGRELRPLRLAGTRLEYTLHRIL